MSDEKIEQEQKSGPYHEMSETPFGGSHPAADGTPAPVENPEPVAEAAEEPVVEEPVAQEPAVEEPVAEEPAVEEAPAVEEKPMTMEEAMAAQAGEVYGGAFKALREGEVVDGVVVHIDREGVLVDVGTKSEGSIKPNELSRDPSANPEDVVSVGEKIRVYVVQADSQEGGPILSKKRADFENAWDRVEHAYRGKEVIKAMVSDRVKGGLVVDLGIRGFVPASHVGSGKLKNLDKFIGQSMPFKVIEVDRERRKVVLSNRLAAEEEHEEVRKQTLSSLAEGQIRDGIVRRITDYGAFVDLGGVDGLLHVSEMSWTRINHPSEAVKVGQRIQVMVLKLNLEQGRVSLGLRQILPDPWVEVQRLHRVGDTITVSITRLVPFGAFAAVEGGVEGIIPNAELAHKRINKPEDVVNVGQEVAVKVIDLRPEERRMTMSLRQLLPPPERRDEPEMRSFTQSRGESRTTIGDLIGEQLGELASSVQESPEKAAKKKSRARAKKAAMAEADALAEVEEFELEEPAQAEAEQAGEEVPEQAMEPQELVVTTEELVGDVKEAIIQTEAAAEETEAEPAEEAPAAEEKPAEEKPAEEKPKRRSRKTKES
jgi:ribosomal protein S1